MVQLVRMNEQHLDRTGTWLAQSAALRAQIDSLDVPTPDGNRRYWQQKFQDKSREDYAILAESARHVGNCGLVAIDARREKAELWIYLGETYGRGVGGEALHLLLNRAFDELKLHRVYIRVVASNPRALAFYLRAGFKVEGHARGDTVQDGKRLDATLLSILSDEHRSRHDRKL
jgi:RimJ/RimL family protein N-acetyltransferase